MTYRRIAVLVVLTALGGALGGAAMAQQERTQRYLLDLVTKVDIPMKIPGMPDMSNLPGMPKSRGDKPYRAISASATYPNRAVDPIFVTVPADLGLKGNKLVLEVPKPVTGEEEEDTPTDPTEEPQGKMELVTKLYWNPGEAKGPITESIKIDGGQFSGPGMMGKMPTPEQLRQFSEDLTKEASGSETDLPEAVVGKGSYPLNTGGVAEMTGFLPPLKVTTPANIAAIDPMAGVLVKWQPVAGARGYLLSARGMNFAEDGERMTVIEWYSTKVEPPMRVRGSYRQETTIADDLKNGILLPGEATSCQIPAGIFDDVMMFSMQVLAIGNDFYSEDNGLTVFGTIRSEWNASMMVGMGAPPTGDEEEGGEVTTDEGGDGADSDSGKDTPDIKDILRGLGKSF